jgi:hypothetical protein
MIKVVIGLLLSVLIGVGTNSHSTTQEWKRPGLETRLHGIGTVLIRSHSPERLADY